MSNLYINGEWYATGTWETCNDIATRRSQDPECQDEVYEIVTEEEDRLPASYAEIEYADMESAEAVAGSRWDDMNYMRYMEQ